MKYLFLLVSCFIVFKASIAQNVGIGTNIPVFKLEVQSDTGTIGVRSSGLNTYSGFFIRTPAGGSDLLRFGNMAGTEFDNLSYTTRLYSNAGPLLLQTTGGAGYPIRITADALPGLNILQTGRLGWGTQTPQAFVDFHNNNDIWHTSIGGNTGRLMIGGQTNNGAVLQSQNPATGLARDLYLQRDGGSIGIGTNNPLARLHVNGPQRIAFNSSFVPQLLLYENENDYARMQFSNVNGNGFTLSGLRAAGNGNDQFNIYSERNSTDLVSVSTDPVSTLKLNGSLNGKNVNFETAHPDIGTVDNIPSSDGTMLSIIKTANPSAFLQISGILGGVDGRILIVINVNSAAPLRLLPEDSRSNVGARFASFYEIPPLSAVTMVYRYPLWYSVSH